MEKDLQRLLDELSAAIARTRDGDQDRAELVALLDAVRRRLDEGAAVSTEEKRNLVDTLQEAELRFEAQHPVLGETIRDAIHALSAAGI